MLALREKGLEGVMQGEEGGLEARTHEKQVRSTREIQ